MYNIYVYNEFKEVRIIRETIKVIILFVVIILGIIICELSGVFDSPVKAEANKILGRIERAIGAGTLAKDITYTERVEYMEYLRSLNGLYDDEDEGIYKIEVPE